MAHRDFARPFFSLEVCSIMRHRIMLGASLAIALMACSALSAGDDLKSGPQVGSKKLPPFNPLNVTGPSAGTRACQV
jgi:hypothetical protein